MIRVFFPGQRVPDWFQKIRVDGKPGYATFSCLCVIWKRGGHYHVRSIIFEPIITIPHQGNLLKVEGQGEKDCIFHCSPVIRNPFKKYYDF